MNSVTKIPSCLARLVARPWDTSVSWSSSSGSLYSLTDRLRSVTRWSEMGFPVPPCNIPSNQPAKLCILCVWNNTAFNDVFSPSLLFSSFTSPLPLVTLLACSLPRPQHVESFDFPSLAVICRSLTSACSGRDERARPRSLMVITLLSSETSRMQSSCEIKGIVREEIREEHGLYSFLKNTNKKENVSKWLLKLYELHGQDKSDWR